MKTIDQLCSYKQSVRLYELGVKTPSLFYHADNYGFKPMINFEEGRGCEPILHKYESQPPSEKWPSAYTVAELGVMLSACLDDDCFISFEQGTSSIGVRYENEYGDGDNDSVYVVEIGTIYTGKGDNEAQQRADLLIWAIEKDPSLIEKINSLEQTN